MDKSIEAMKLALEAFKQIDEAMPFPVAKLAQKAIREALAEQPAQQRHISYVCPQCFWSLDEKAAQQQEPVAWMWRCKPYCDWPEWSVSLKRPADSGRDGHKRTEGYEDVPLYTSPPASKPLSPDEVCRLWKRHTDVDGPHYNPYDDDGLGFARAIEAAHGIKENT